MTEHQNDQGANVVFCTAKAELQSAPIRISEPTTRLGQIFGSGAVCPNFRRKPGDIPQRKRVDMPIPPKYIKEGPGKDIIVLACTQNSCMHHANSDDVLYDMPIVLEPNT